METLRDHRRPHRNFEAQPEIRHREEATAIHWAGCRCAGGVVVLGDGDCEQGGGVRFRLFGIGDNRLGW